MPPALSAALLALLAGVALLVLAALPATADAGTGPGQTCASAQVTDPLCRAQRLALQVTAECDEPPGETCPLALSALTAPRGARVAVFVRGPEVAPGEITAGLPKRPPRSA